MAGLCSLWGMSWCIGDDFSITLFLSERLGGSIVNSVMVDDSNFILEQDHLDIHLVGGTLTWSSMVES